MTLNEMDMTITLKRIDICDLMLACLAADSISNGAEKWGKLHDKLTKLIIEFDHEQGY